jgi:hypothetical protein
MTHAHDLAAIPPDLIVMAIAKEAARVQALEATQKAATPAAARVERLVRFGDWREPIAKQLAHPEQLREDHLLRCEILLARANEKRPGFLPVDAAAAKSLALPLLPAQFCLKLLEDPTRASSDGRRRSLIPERYRKPWEFRMARADAIAQMNVEAKPSLFQRLGRMFSRRATERAIDRWQGQLDGKPLLDQLWGVRPPHCAFEREAVRQWVASTLGRYGFDPARGVCEWEIFWRRKGA